MTNDAAMFGRPDRFGIAVQWVGDDATTKRAPAAYGWSMGQLTLTVAGVNLTACRVGDARQEYVGWYLGPLLRWLARNWVPLLHEERFAWPVRDAAPAVSVCRRALDRWRGTEGEEERRHYRSVQAWGARHGLRWAAAGGLFPDLFIRRLGDDVELSWSGEPPPYGPEGLSFESGAGVATLSVNEVADPLWSLLRWVCERPRTIDDATREDWECLNAEVDAIRDLNPFEAEAEAVTSDLLRRVRATFAEIGYTNLVDAKITAEQPYIAEFPMAVAMYGGLNPNLTDNDVRTLRDVLVSALGGTEDATLTGLVAERNGRLLGRVPHEDGLTYAFEFLDDLLQIDDDLTASGKVDVLGICARLGVDVCESRLDTGTVRGVALAGDGLQPRILINLTSPFNASRAGKRFTVAHELCHILFDRNRARRIVHSSGPWAAPGIEKRANAFAAYLLMPPHLVRRYLPGSNDMSPQAVREAAKRLDVGTTALIEHLYNLDLIDEGERELLRTHLTKR